MKPSRIYYAGAFGRAAAKLVAANVSHACDLGPAESVDYLPQGPVEGAPTAVFLSSPGLLSMEGIAQSIGTAPWICALPFERHVVVSPVFRPGSACIRCFVKRWLCQPPEGYHGEVVHAISVFCRDHSIREYKNLSPLAAQFAAKLLLKNATEDSHAAICYDTASLQLQSAPIRALHGCSCRTGSSHGTGRFATFSKTLQDFVANMGSVHGKTDNLV